MEIDILDLQGEPVDTGLVRLAAQAVARGRAPEGGRAVVALADDARVTELNRAHRGLDRPTDVLAYEGDEDDPGYAGDVVISVQTADRQAREAGRPLDHEVAWLAAHGVLHLLGHDDVTDEERAEMVRLQDAALEEALSGKGQVGP